MTTTRVSEHIALRGDQLSAPKKLPIEISKYQILDQKQAGHLRHFHNLASQPAGDWSLMGAAEPAQVLCLDLHSPFRGSRSRELTCIRQNRNGSTPIDTS